MRRIFCDLCGKEIDKPESEIYTISVFIPKNGWCGDSDLDLCNDCFEGVNKILNGLLTRKREVENETKNLERDSNGNK